MRRPALCLVAGLLALGACGGEDQPAAAPTTTMRSLPVAVAPPTSSTVAPTTTLAVAPPVTVDLCTEARTAAADFELTHEESAARFDGLAARATDPGLVEALQGLAAAFRAGASSVSTADLDAHCP